MWDMTHSYAFAYGMYRAWCIHMSHAISWLQGNTVHSSATQCIPVQHTSTQCNTLQHRDLFMWVMWYLHYMSHMIYDSYDNESYDTWVIWYLQKSPAMKTSHEWMTHDPYAHIMHNTSHIQTHTNKSYLICEWLLDPKSPAMKISHEWCLIYEWLLVKDVYLCVSCLFVCVRDLTWMMSHIWMTTHEISSLQALQGFWHPIQGSFIRLSWVFEKIQFRALLQDSFDRMCVGRWLRWVGSLKF